MEEDMSDEIFIKDLLVRTVLGIDEEERRDKQDVLVSVSLETETYASGRSDNIEDSVNYRTVSKRILALAEESQSHLVEQFAEKIAAICLEEPRVRRVRVTAEKPGALRFARSVGVTIERGRNHG
jgi:D-erythro-7,8-dihydroneopterin triphosphate epimerase